jgi:hypothetical protein
LCACDRVVTSDAVHAAERLHVHAMIRRRPQHEPRLQRESFSAHRARAVDVVLERDDIAQVRPPVRVPLLERIDHLNERARLDRPLGQVRAVDLDAADGDDATALRSPQPFQQLILREDPGLEVEELSIEWLM